MINALNNSFSSITNGNSALQSARTNSENAKFLELIKSLKENTDDKTNENSTISSNMVLDKSKINGDFTTGFSKTFTYETDKNSLPRGAAANQANPNVKTKLIDRTSELYEKALELESYFVKQMLNSMRNTIMKTGESDFAQETYEDMLFDEYAQSMTKNAGFGLADQIYMQLA